MFLHLCASDLELDCSGSLRLFGKLVPPARSFLVVDCFFPTGVAEAPTGVGGLARECAAPSCPGPTPADGGAGAATLREHPAQCKQVGPGVLLGTLWGAAPTSGDSEAKPMASLLLAASRNSPSSLAPTCRLRVRAPLTRHWRLPEQPGAYEALMLRRYAPGNSLTVQFDPSSKTTGCAALFDFSALEPTTKPCPPAPSPSTAASKASTRACGDFIPPRGRPRSFGPRGTPEASAADCPAAEAVGPVDKGSQDYGEEVLPFAAELPEAHQMPSRPAQWVEIVRPLPKEPPKAFLLATGSFLILSSLARVAARQLLRLH
eukprot:GHVT01079425.1.p1 GENE.GHVT01079425.1~~GHVT01079425.1.p1  ORF type:complete len:318 (-),score=78.03 GHVT01079425.1:1346-2299(-)